MNLLNELVQLNEMRNKVFDRQTKLDDVRLDVDWNHTAKVGRAQVKTDALTTADKGDGVSEVYLRVAYDGVTLKCQVYYEPFLGILHGFDQGKAQDFELMVDGMGDEDQNQAEYENLKKVIAYYMVNEFPEIAQHYLEQHKAEVSENNGAWD